MSAVGAGVGYRREAAAAARIERAAAGVPPEPQVDRDAVCPVHVCLETQLVAYAERLVRAWRVTEEGHRGARAAFRETISR